MLVPVPEVAPVCKSNALFGGSQMAQTPITRSQNGEITMGSNSTDGEEHNLKDESLPNEDPTIEMANQEPHPLEGFAEEMATSVDGAMCKDIKHDQDHLSNFNGGNQTPGRHTQNGYATMRLSTMDGEKHNREDESLPNEVPTTETENQAPQMSEGPAEETTTFVDRAPCEAIKHNQDHPENEHEPAENFNGESTRNLTNEPYPELYRKNSSGVECEVVREVNSRNKETPETEDKSSIQATTNCKKSNQEAAGPACFNPHLLPPQSDPKKFI